MITQLDLSTLFEDLALRQPDMLAERLAEAGIPQSVRDLADNDLLLALAGIRAAVASWSPRPALLDSDEQHTLQSVLAGLVTSETQRIVETYLERFSKAVMRTRKALVDWNSSRRALQVAPTDADIAALSDNAAGIDRDGVRFVDAGNGQQVARYVVRPDPRDVQDELRRERERRRRERERVQQGQG